VVCVDKRWFVGRHTLVCGPVHACAACVMCAQEMFDERGIRRTTFLISELSPQRLALVDGIDAWVQVGCLTAQYMHMSASAHTHMYAISFAHTCHTAFRNQVLMHEHVCTCTWLVHSILKSRSRCISLEAQQSRVVPKYAGAALAQEHADTAQVYEHAGASDTTATSAVGHSWCSF